MEQIHTLPTVNYLAKVRNTEESVETEETHGGHAAQNEAPGVPSEHKEEVHYHLTLSTSGEGTAHKGQLK